MVTLPSDLEWVRCRLQQVAAELGVARLPPLGAMIETPAAALCVDLLARHADFFSLDTNDLTQYVMAAGREDPFVAEYYQEDHPAVRRLVDSTMRLIPDKPVVLCGEAAGLGGVSADGDHHRQRGPAAHSAGQERRARIGAPLGKRRNGDVISGCQIAVAPPIGLRRRWCGR